MTVAQYVNLDWFVTKEDHERAVEYAKRHGLTKPCDLMHHLLDLAVDVERIPIPTIEALAAMSTSVEPPRPHDEY